MAVAGLGAEAETRLGGWGWKPVIEMIGDEESIHSGHFTVFNCESGLWDC
ncbi:malate cytoplasmic isoform 2 [Sesbania bispinosa]|nr:malate cytoplasmic isoform 2 [Sesbania bispinosa]